MGFACLCSETKSCKNEQSPWGLDSATVDWLWQHQYSSSSWLTVIDNIDNYRFAIWFSAVSCPLHFLLFNTNPAVEFPAGILSYLWEHLSSLLTEKCIHVVFIPAARICWAGCSQRQGLVCPYWQSACIYFCSGSVLLWYQILIYICELSSITQGNHSWAPAARA